MQARIVQPAAANGMAEIGRATIVLNESSRGAGKRRAVDDACARAGLDARVVRVGPADLVAAAERAAEDADVLIAAGGDGTVSAVASAAVSAGVTFGVIPLGTLNHFARDAGIPRTLDAALAVIVAGCTKWLDVGIVNAAVFLNNASLGMYPRLVWERQLEEARGRGRWTAFAIALARSWRTYRTIDVQITIDGAPIKRQTPFVFIGNGEYGVEGLELGIRQSIDGGRLWVFVAPGCSRWDALALPLRALAKRPPAGTFECFSATELTVDIDRREVSVALDGELMLAPPPFRFTIHPRTLRTLVPEDH